MIDYVQLLILGAIAGFTIFLGLPLAALQNVSPRTKGFLSAVAMGILVFLIIDVFSHAWSNVSNSIVTSTDAKSPGELVDLVALFGGIAIGLLGLTFYERRYMGERPRVIGPEIVTNDIAGEDSLPIPEEHKLRPTKQSPVSVFPESSQATSAYKLSMMIAIGIGAHNFSEGLAIGQSYASGSIGLALILVIGFGAHNATEGFGIAGPLTGLAKRPSLRFLLTAGLIGGGPTFLGTLTGSLVGVSNFAYVFFLSIAGGALVYVTLLMYSSGRRQAGNDVLMSGIFIGLCLGFITDLIVTMGGA